MQAAKLWISIGVTAATLIAIAWAIDVRALADAVTGVDARYLLATAVIVGLVSLIRAKRVADELGEPLGREVLELSTAHNVLAAVMPARSGELALPVLLKHRRGLSLARGALILLRLRLLDLSACVGVGTLAYAWSPVGLGFRASSGLLAAAGLALAAAAAALGCAMPAVAGTDRVPHAWRARLGFLDPSATDAKEGRAWASGPRQLAASAAIWLLICLGFLLCAAATGLEADALAIAVASTLASLVMNLPASGVGNFGPAQLAWGASLAAYGHALPAALAAAFLMQGISLLVPGLILAGLTATSGARPPGLPRPDHPPRTS